MNEVYRDKDWLQVHYLVQGLTMQECATLAKCSCGTIWQWLKKYNIPRRTNNNKYEYTAEVRQKMSDAKKTHHARGCYDNVYAKKEYRQKMSGSAKVARTRGCYDGVFQSPTSIEIAISEALDELGIMHVQQYRPEGCSFTYDEYLLAWGILLEVNGDYWHTREDAPERDAHKAAWAREHGFLPVTIWEGEIKERGALAMIQERVGLQAAQDEL